jgi:hypothetical protein
VRYRKLDANGDYSFGQGQDNFWINQPEAVAQSVLTRLMLWQGQWFADTSDGTAWATEVLGERTAATRDLVVQTRVNETAGVSDIAAYSSAVDPNARTFAVGMTIDTVYGIGTLTVTGAPLPVTVPPLVAPPSTGGPGPAVELEITGVPVAAMQPANLLVGPAAMITNFQIGSIDSGTYP